ncbi:MAG: transposase, partial [candidate division Zixibacteria bacterium]|nr:transposase [candidate division Zixibacteria bacterium]
PALSAAMDTSKSKCFFIGRRGTGKTAITYYLAEKRSTAISIHPQVLSPLLFPLDSQSLKDPRQRPFRSLVEAFKRSLQDEVLSEWINRRLVKIDKLPTILQREMKYITDFDFDLRMLEFLDRACGYLKANNESDWLKEIGLSKKMGKAMMDTAENSPINFTLLIDRIDDCWDGSDTAVIMLMALMHACIELVTSVKCVRPLLFLRENVFDRVRQIDKESTRLETCVVSMDWTREQLKEMIERRLSLPFSTKLPIGGPTWDNFFEKTDSGMSDSLIFGYCQNRPRDVLTYCSFAIELAQVRRHNIVSIQDIVDARKRFSETRLKDLGDEYAENYSQISLVLSRFYGLGKEFTFGGIEDFIKKILTDEEVSAHCCSWIYEYTTPEQFIHLLYNIGFVGIKQNNDVTYRSLGPSSSSPPAITSETQIVIHPSYVDALDLRDAVISRLEKDESWQRTGFLSDLPGALDLKDYVSKLNVILEELKTLPEGLENAKRWEDIIGEIIKLCFWKWLANAEPKEREVDGCIVRDWIAS